ncbi:LysR family transcriptional regulator [Pseudoroseicyclus aestuarii]|uniref:DNA-binding transcriptional LysR family regulator n=1 Tax=Pseudoroseicyclus aestuarii TaxID=1795041 RepID=A0A318SZP3_9RHOB|nr:LysR family transcriptional regulator [Pseudoroseicyclus aestuarii]PYE85896.1 DNA-binding transcriptional LysR family regulator [Pseudoroseicyclus aestuarii]
MQGANLGDILIFLSVVEAGGFAAGSRAQGLSRSAAGKAVARLEERLGARLLSRTTRRLGLTEEGARFHAHALQVRASVRQAEASVSEGAGTPRGTLRLTVPDAYGRIVLMPLVQRFLRDWPELRAEVEFSDRTTDIVEAGHDLAVRIGGERLPDAGLTARVVARHGTRLCAAPGYLAARPGPRDATDLADHACLPFSGSAGRQAWRLRATGAEAWQTVPARGRLSLGSGEALRDAALSGLGIALLPGFLADPEIEAGRLQPVLADHTTEAIAVTALYPERRLLEPRVRRFIDLMVAALPR